jgi:hypothetical protein
MPFPVACFPFPDVGNKHWKLDYANVRIPISKTPSDRRGAQNTATDIANRCF